MSTIARTGGASYGGVEKFAGPGAGNSALHTSLYSVANPGIREALQRFDDVALDFPSKSGWVRKTRLVDALRPPCVTPTYFEDNEAATVINGPSTGVDVTVPAPTFLPMGVWSETTVAQVDVDLAANMASAILPALVLGINANFGSLMSEVVARISASTSAHQTAAYDLILRLPWKRGVELELAETSVISETSVAGQGDAVATVRGLAKFFGLPLGDILKAARISKSSFHSWDKPNQPKPRTSSQGGLWALAQLAGELNEALPGPVSEWLLADEGHLKLLREGQFDELFARVFERPFRRGEGAATAYAAAYGVTDVMAGPLAKNPDSFVPTAQPRRTRVAKRAVRGPRRES